MFYVVCISASHPIVSYCHVVCCVDLTLHFVCIVVVHHPSPYYCILACMFHLCTWHHVDFYVELATFLWNVCFRFALFLTNMQFVFVSWLLLGEDRMAMMTT